MAKPQTGEENTILRAQADIWRQIFSFVDSNALKCAAKLGIADVINRHGTAISLSQIANAISPPPPNIENLHRLMTFLVRRGIFSANHRKDPEAEMHECKGEILYGLTDSSKWIMRDSELSLLPILLLENLPLLVNPWNSLDRCIKEGGTAFAKENGSEIWEFALANPEYNQLFNDAMASTSKIFMRAVLSKYEGGFEKIGSIVDVGGGIGTTVSEIVKKYPHIKGINFDLPHVVATAPQFRGVSHIAGDMFISLPEADAVLFKWVMHNWSDEDCIKILHNCRKAIPKTTGKLIIIDIVLDFEENDLFSDMGLIFDLLMMVNTRGKERTKEGWKTILEEGGFNLYKVIKIPCLLSIIEAFPK